MNEVVVSQAESDQVRDGLFSIGVLEIGPSDGKGSFDVITHFAGGEPANNKITADLPLEQHSPDMPVTVDELAVVREGALQALEKLLATFERRPDTLWGVPSGGQSYAQELAGRLGMKVVFLDKVDNLPGKKTYKPKTDDDARKLAEAETMVGIEDIGSEGTSLYGALYDSDDHGLDALREKTQGLGFLWIRGALSRLQGKDIPIRTIVDEPIPNILTERDDFYLRFGYLAANRAEPA